MGSRLWADKPLVPPGQGCLMEARLVWDVWRRILQSDQLVAYVSGETDTYNDTRPSLTSAEREIIDNYARSPVATATNIDMYRQGLIRNALGGLSHVPLSQHLLYMADLDPSLIAEQFTEATGYRDFGPNFWSSALAFVEFIAELPAFSTPSGQDILNLDRMTAVLALRLGGTEPQFWPEGNSLSPSTSRQNEATDGPETFSVTDAATLVETGSDLSGWIEDPYGFDPEEELETLACFWLIYFAAPAGKAEYLQLSARSASLIRALDKPRATDELSTATGITADDIESILESLTELGVVQPAVAPDKVGKKPRSSKMPETAGSAILSIVSTDAAS